MSKPTIEQALVNSGLITQEQLQHCMNDTTNQGKSLHECLLSNKFVTPDALAQWYAKYTNNSYLPLIADKMIDLDLLAKVPLTFLRQHGVIPIVIDDTQTLVVANPFHYEPIDELALLFGKQLAVQIAPINVIIDAINRHYPLEGTKQMIEELEEDTQDAGEVAFEEIEGTDILAMATEAPIIKLVNHILFQAVKRNASDIHIEPFEKEVRVRYRIDGVMYTTMNPPKRVQGPLISRIKIMANLDIAEKRMTQDGRIQIKVADKAIDIRISILPVAFGERIVMRLLDRTRSIGKIEDMGLSERDYKVLIQAIARPNGIIYITGPTGSGKTTTLYSILAELNKPDVNVITVEDPVEYQLAGIGQVQVKEKIGLTFAIALRAILRQDPDIVMIGETRDQETAQIAIQASLTGHLVLSTLHTNSAPASITRLIDMAIEPFLIASSMTIAVAQRLVRKLCPACKKPYLPPAPLLQQVGINEHEAKKITFYQAHGCELCEQAGYRGRIAIFEIMEMTERIIRLVMQRADTGAIRNQAIADGMTPLIIDGVRKVTLGLTTIEEVLSVASMDQAELEP